MLKKAAKLKFNIEKIINEKFQAIQRNQFNIQLSLISHSLYLWGKIYRWSPAEWFRLITLMLRWLGLISWCMHTRLIKKIFSWINFKFHIIIIERAIDRCREREGEKRARMFYAEYKHKVHISSRVFVRKIALVVAQSTFVDPKEKNITREPRAREENFFFTFSLFLWVERAQKNLHDDDETHLESNRHTEFSRSSWIGNSTERARERASNRRNINLQWNSWSSTINHLAGVWESKKRHDR